MDLIEAPEGEATPEEWKHRLAEDYVWATSTISSDGQSSTASSPGLAVSYGLYSQDTFLGLNWGMQVFYARLKSATYTFADKSTDIRSQQHLYGTGLNARLFLNDSWALITEVGYLGGISDSSKTAKRELLNKPYVMGGMELDLLDFGTARLGVNAKYQWSKDVRLVMAGLSLNF